MRVVEEDGADVFKFVRLEVQDCLGLVLTDEEDLGGVVDGVVVVVVVFIVADGDEGGAQQPRVQRGRFQLGDCTCALITVNQLSACLARATLGAILTEASQRPKQMKCRRLLVRYVYVSATNRRFNAL